MYVQTLVSNLWAKQIAKIVYGTFRNCIMSPLMAPFIIIVVLRSYWQW